MPAQPKFQAVQWRSPEEKLSQMAALSVGFGHHPKMRQVAIQILLAAGVRYPDKNPAQALAAILAWTQANVAFIAESGEQLQTPWTTLELQAGDCDDHAILMGSLLSSIRFPWAFAVFVNPGAEQSHVSIAGRVDGEWVNLDSTEPRWTVGMRPPAEWEAHIFPVPDDQPGFPAQHAANQEVQAANNGGGSQLGQQSLWPQAAKVAYASAGLLGMAAGVFHGTRRNDSLPWGLAWGAFGAVFPFVAVPLALAQGFGERKVA